MPWSLRSQSSGQQPAPRTDRWRDRKPREFAYNTAEWKRIRGKAILRAGGACSVCGERDRLIVHHINLDAADNSIANLVVLCRKCHEIKHGRRKH